MSVVKYVYYNQESGDLTCRSIERNKNTCWTPIWVQKRCVHLRFLIVKKGGLALVITTAMRVVSLLTISTTARFYKRCVIGVIAVLNMSGVRRPQEKVTEPTVVCRITGRRSTMSLLPKTRMRLAISPLERLPVLSGDDCLDTVASYFPARHRRACVGDEFFIA